MVVVVAIEHQEGVACHELFNAYGAIFLDFLILPKLLVFDFFELVFSESPAYRANSGLQGKHLLISHILLLELLLQAELNGLVELRIHGPRHHLLLQKVQLLILVSVLILSGIVWPCPSLIFKLQFSLLAFEFPVLTPYLGIFSDHFVNLSIFLL